MFLRYVHVWASRWEAIEAYSIYKHTLQFYLCQWLKTNFMPDLMGPGGFLRHMAEEQDVTETEEVPTSSRSFPTWIIPWSRFQRQPWIWEVKLKRPVEVLGNDLTFLRSPQCTGSVWGPSSEETVQSALIGHPYSPSGMWSHHFPLNFHINISRSRNLMKFTAMLPVQATAQIIITATAAW